MDTVSRIIDHVYSAALDAARWPSAVVSLRKHFDCAAAGFYIHDVGRGTLRFLHVNGVDADFQRTYMERHLRCNPWDEPALQAPGRIRTEYTLDEHFKRPGYYRRTALFNEWMKPQDFINTMGMNLSANRRERTKVFLYRAARTGPFARADVERFTYLSGHLMNAVEVASRLAEQACRTAQALDLLECVDLGVAFVDDHGCVIEANAFAERLLAEADALRLERGRVAAAHRGDDTRLARLLRRVLAVREGCPAAAPATVELRSRTGRAALRLRAVPLSRASDDPFCKRRAAAALVMTPKDADTTASDEALRRQYGFTAAELHLVQWLLCGLSLRQAAELSRVKYETARWHLKNVFQKTGVNRQAELVRRLMADRPRLN